MNYSNLPLKLWKERKYAIELIPVKSYKKGLMFPVVKSVKDITLAKASKGVFTIVNASVIPMLPITECGAIKACKKFAFR